MKEGDDTVLGGNEMDRALFEFAEPGGEYLRRVHSGRKKNELYGGVQEDHRLLPDGAPVLVVDIVTFIEHDGVEAIQRKGRSDAERLCGRAALVQEIPQDLGGHDDHVGVRLELDVTCHDAHAIREDLLEVVELLVAEGLDRGRIEYAPALFKTVGDLVFADEGLAGACLGSHEDVGAFRDG